MTPGECCSGQQDLMSSAVGVGGVAIQVVREDLTRMCFFLQSIKVKNRKFSVRFIYSRNLFGKNAGNEQTLHFCFKIQYLGRLERTTKCYKFGCSRLTFYILQIAAFIEFATTYLYSCLAEWLLHQTYCKPSSVWWPQESQEAATEMVLKPLIFIISPKQINSRIYKLWSAYYVPCIYKHLECLHFHFLGVNILPTYNLMMQELGPERCQATCSRSYSY